jgi:hypothetical protein
MKLILMKNKPFSTNRNIICIALSHNLISRKVFFKESNLFLEEKDKQEKKIMLKNDAQNECFH